MKLLHLLSIMGTALSLVHAANYPQWPLIEIRGHTAIIHDIEVYAKPMSDAEKSRMTANANADDDCIYQHRDHVTNKCPEIYNTVALMSFARPTVDPRPVTVKIKDYTIECTFALNQAMNGRRVVWNIHKDWGMNGNKSDFQIKCDNSTAFYGEPYGSP